MYTVIMIEKRNKSASMTLKGWLSFMRKGMKVFLIVFTSVVAAVVTANVLTEIFKTRLNKYYSVER